MQRSFSPENLRRPAIFSPARRLGSALFLAGILLAAEESAPDRADKLRNEAAAGNRNAMFQLGDEYFYGTGTRLSNPTLAAYWYRKAADAGLPEAMFNYAICLERGLGVERNRFEAYDWMKKAADAGVKLARYQTAMTDLQGIPEDKERGLPAKRPLVSYAVSQLEQLAAEHFVPAETTLAQLLLAQKGEREAERAVKILQRLIALKEPPPAALRMMADCKYAGRGVPRNPAEMIQLLRRAARLGDAEALGKLAFCYEYGRAVDPDLKKAARLYRLSAERGNAMSQFKYAEFTANGTITKEPDIHSALSWYRKAAEQKNPQALFKLGVFHLEGIGMKKDPRKAAELFFESATRGYPRAQYNLGCLYAAGDGGLVKDESAAVYWFGLAAKGGDAVAQRALALRYLEGRGVTRSITKGEEWLLKAAENGDLEARELLLRRGLAPPSLW